MYSNIFNEISSKVYGETLSYVNFGTSLIWLLTYLPMNFVANYVLDEYGLKAGVA
jgi:hypothetical protein